MKRQAVGFALRVTLVAMVMAVMAVSTLASAADAAGEVRVGLLAPMSGPAAKFGQIERSTLTLAMEEINNAGGIKSLGGAKLRLIIGDSRGEADIGVTETERLITREKVHVIIGAFQSAVAFPASAVAERYQIPWLNDATVDKITERGFKYVFRAEGNDSQKAKTLIDGIVALSRKSTPIKTAVIFSENTEWGNSVGECLGRVSARTGTAVCGSVAGGDRGARLGMAAGNSLPRRRHAQQLDRPTICARCWKPFPGGRGWRLPSKPRLAPSSRDQARHWVACGINRVSLGVQSFVEKRDSAHGAQTHGGNGRSGTAAAARGRHRQYQHRPDRRTFRADRSELAGIARLDRAPRAGARLDLHAGSG